MADRLHIRKQSKPIPSRSPLPGAQSHVIPGKSGAPCRPPAKSGWVCGVLTLSQGLANGWPTLSQASDGHLRKSVDLTGRAGKTIGQIQPPLCEAGGPPICCPVTLSASRWHSTRPGDAVSSRPRAPGRVGAPLRAPLGICVNKITRPPSGPQRVCFCNTFSLHRNLSEKPK